MTYMRYHDFEARWREQDANAPTDPPATMLGLGTCGHNANCGCGAPRDDYPGDPCFCNGPFADMDPADRPDSVLGREHVTGDPGCLYVANSWTPTGGA